MNKITRHCDAVYPKEKLAVDYSEPIEVYAQETVMNSRGVASKVSKKTMYDPADAMSKYRVNDFILENVIAAGAVDMLKDCSVKLGGLEAAECADRVFDTIQNSISTLSGF